MEWLITTLFLIQLSQTPWPSSFSFWFHSLSCSERSLCKSNQCLWINLKCNNDFFFKVQSCAYRGELLPSLGKHGDLFGAPQFSHPGRREVWWSKGWGRLWARRRSPRDPDLPTEDPAEVGGCGHRKKTSLDPDGVWVCDVAATFMWVSFIAFHSVSVSVATASSSWVPRMHATGTPICHTEDVFMITTVLFTLEARNETSHMKDLGRKASCKLR